MKISLEVQNIIGKHLSCSSSSPAASFENTELTNHTMNHVNRFLSNLVHRHVMFPLTLLLRMINPDNTL